MAKYDVHYKCGHVGEVSLFGPTKDREWRIENLESDICPECQAEEYKKKNQEAMALATEMDLPELKGSEKQIEWASSIRLKFVEIFVDEITPRMDDGQPSKNVRSMYDYILENKTRASYWIDNRVKGSLMTSEMIRRMMIDISDEWEKNKIDVAEEVIKKEIINEFAVYPENRKSDAVVEIRIDDNQISILSEKNEEIIAIAKSLKYKWRDRAWRRVIHLFASPLEDRVAEIGNKLLNAGFPISIQDEILRRKAVMADYEPECTRWVSKEVDKSELCIDFDRNDTIYNAARNIKSSRYKNGTIYVDVAHYDDVLAFADTFGFKVSDGAKKLIAEYIDELKRLKKVTPAQLVEIEESDVLSEILESSREVITDLIDE